jgi:quinol monooxygenase YgiN
MYFAMERLSYLKVFTVGVIVGGVIASLLLFKSVEPSVSSQRESIHRNVFVLGVSIKFKSQKAKMEFKHIFLPLAKYVALKEMNTLSYELAESDKDPLLVYLTERYKTKSDYLDIHRKSKEFLEFRQKFSDMKESYEMSGESYIETNIGFM